MTPLHISVCHYNSLDEGEGESSLGTLEEKDRNKREVATILNSHCASVRRMLAACFIDFDCYLERMIIKWGDYEWGDYDLELIPFRGEWVAWTIHFMIIKI